MRHTNIVTINVTEERFCVTEERFCVTEERFCTTEERLLATEEWFSVTEERFYFVYRLVLDAKPDRVDAVVG